MNPTPAATDALSDELKALARAAGLLTPHILPDNRRLTQAETALLLRKSGLSILGPLAVNSAAPDESNMYLLGKVGSPEIQKRFLAALVAGHARSAFFMTQGKMTAGDGAAHLTAAASPRPALQYKVRLRTMKDHARAPAVAGQVVSSPSK